MNDFYKNLEKIALLELELFNEEVFVENTPIITKEIILKNGLMIRITKWFGMDAFVKFNHKTDIDSFTFKELIETDYIPEKYQKNEFLEVHSRNLAFGNMV